MARKLSTVTLLIDFYRTGLVPLEVPVNVLHKVPCKCRKCGQVTLQNASKIRDGRGACKFCARQEYPAEVIERTMMTAMLRPRIPFAGGKVPWECDCLRCGAVVKPRFDHIYFGRSKGCRFCAGQVVTDARKQEVCDQADFVPDEDYPGASRPWRGTHRICGRPVAPYWVTLRKGSAGCKHCNYDCPNDCYCRTVCSGDGCSKKITGTHGFCGEHAYQRFAGETV